MFCFVQDHVILMTLSKQCYSKEQNNCLKRLYVYMYCAWRIVLNEKPVRWPKQFCFQSKVRPQNITPFFLQTHFNTFWLCGYLSRCRCHSTYTSFTDVKCITGIRFGPHGLAFRQFLLSLERLLKKDECLFLIRHFLVVLTPIYVLDLCHWFVKL